MEMSFLEILFHSYTNRAIVFFTELNWYIPVTIIFFVVLYFYSYKNWVREGINYHPFSETSSPNAKNQISGNRWTANSLLKRVFKKSRKATLKIDNFDFHKFHYKKNVSIFVKLWFNFFSKKAEIFTEPINMCQSLTMLAPMGGGKTVTMEALLNQYWYNRALINEEKGGDMVTRRYNRRKDIIMCPYDDRAHVWDVLSEDIAIIEFFIINCINATSGGDDKSSFFTNDAKERYKQLAMLTLEIQDPLEKWKFFIKEFEEMEKEVEQGDQKSAKDVISTMKQILTLLKINLYQLECGKKSFTIKDFFKKNHQNKIFMVNVDAYKVHLEILFSAFTACFAMIHASQKDTKDDITFYLLDEYLSLKMNFEAKLLLHTKIRSKGGALLCAMHYFPDEQKIFDLLTSSTYAYMIFSVKNVKTREFFDKQIGEREYVTRKNLNNQIHEQKLNESLLDWAEIDRLEDEKKHITYIPSKGALFVAKSDYIDTKQNKEAFILDKNIHNFYLKLNDEYRAKKAEKKGIADATKAIFEADKGDAA